MLVPMLDEARERYSYLAAAGADADKVRGANLPVHVGMCGWVLRNERSLLFGESSPFPMDETTAWEKGQQSSLLVPLFGRNKIIGGLSALGKIGGGSFYRHDLDLMTMFANQVSTAIENALLFRRIETEVGERKRSEATVRENEAFIRSILESVGEGLIVMDRDHRILVANRAYCELVQAAPADVVGKLCYQCSHHAERPCYELGEECAIRKTFETGEACSVIHVHQDPQGNRAFIEVRSFPLRDEAGGVSAAIEILNDVTEKRQLESQLHQAQKMEAIGTLAGGVAHDFNNILSAIVGYASLLQMKMRPDDPLYGYVKQILDAADKAGLLTKSLLAFSRKQVVELSPVDVNEVIENFQKILARLIGEDIAIKVTRSPVPLVVDADKGQLEQVLMNLATNARDAMPSGGALQITTASVEPRRFEYGHARHQRPGKVRVPHGVRYRQRHGAGAARSYLRAVFHDEGTAQGHGPGAFDRLRHHRQARRLCESLQRARAWDDVQDLSPREPQGATAPPSGGTGAPPSGSRDDPAGRG